MGYGFECVCRYSPSRLTKPTPQSVPGQDLYPRSPCACMGVRVASEGWPQGPCSHVPMLPFFNEGRQWAHACHGLGKRVQARCRWATCVLCGTATPHFRPFSGGGVVDVSTWCARCYCVYFTNANDAAACPSFWGACSASCFVEICVDAYFLAWFVCVCVLAWRRVPGCHSKARFPCQPLSSLSHEGKGDRGHYPHLV